MNRLTLILNLTIILVLTTSCGSVKVKVDQQKENKTEIMAKPHMAHTVYFWVKEGTSEADRKAFEKGLTKLGTVPAIHTFHWGQPASTEERDVVDVSYHYAINSFFASLEDQLTYQEHPIHLKFIEDHSQIWEKVKVYDNLTN